MLRERFGSVCIYACFVLDCQYFNSSVRYIDVMKIEFRNIKDESQEAERFRMLRRMKNLLVDSFPEEEYRDLGEVDRVTFSDPAFSNMLVFADGEFAGILTWWKLDGFVYIEHFATLPELRNRGYGAQILKGFLERVGEPVVLEAEPAESELAARRIAFYSRCGFTLWDTPYLQPPYRTGHSPFPLKLMVYGSLDEQRDFSQVSHQIHSRVYPSL